MKNTLFIFALLAMFIGTSCAPQSTACGSKSQHKKRASKSRAMAPSMMGKR